LDLAESFNLSNTSINHPPVANAGANQYRTVGNSIFLGGAATDSDGDSPLYYSWSLAKPSGSSAHLSATTTANVSFVADVAGTYTATLIANDGISPSLPSTVLIFVSAPVSNQPPTAFAGPNQLRRTGDTVLLMGKGTDPEGKPVTYQWSLTPPSGSSTNLMNASSATASFFADREGTFTAKLKVGDGTLSTTSTALVYIVDPVHNNPPTANAGPDQLRHPGDKVYVMGKAVDSDGDSPLNFKWTLTGPTGSASVLYNATLPTAYFYPDRLGIYTATLVTSDASSSSSPDSAKVYVVSAEVTDVATGSEMVEETPQVDLPDEPFDAPSSDEEEKQPLQPLSVLILAKDGRSGSDVDPDHGNHVTIGNEIILDGTGSEAGEAAVFEWTFVETPDGSEAKLVEAENGVARFVPDMPGRYTVGLKVSEGKLSAATERSFQAVEEPLDSEAQQESASMEAAGGGCSLVRRP
jgi:hypothetical protein